MLITGSTVDADTRFTGICSSEALMIAVLDIAETSGPNTLSYAYFLSNFDLF
jgi:hypothetical protein